MKPLHAPWRIQYILGPKPPSSESSIFSQMAAHPEDDDPYNGGHLMVIPFRQIPSIGELTDKELLEIMRMVQTCQTALLKTMHPDGFNIGINQGRVAGAGIAEHLHIHVVPRWNGDSNFMPVIAETSVLPQALSELAANLRKVISDLTTS